MSASGRADHKIRAELKRIEILQRKWSALDTAERAAVAKVSPDLSLFFRAHAGTKKLTTFSIMPPQRRDRFASALRLGPSLPAGTVAQHRSDEHS